MKGLFQCPPWAAPWVVMDATLSPCKGKSFKIPGNKQSFCLAILGYKGITFLEMAKNNPNFFFVIQKKMSSFADEM